MSRDLKAIVEELATGGRLESRGRRIQSSTKLGDADDGTSTIHLALSVHHWKDSKAFGIVAHIEAREERSEHGYAVSRWEPMNSRHNLRFKPIPVARYSDKALQAAWDTIAATLRNNPAILEDLDLDAKQVA